MIPFDEFVPLTNVAVVTNTYFLSGYSPAGGIINKYTKNDTAADFHYLFPALFKIILFLTFRFYLK